MSVPTAASSQDTGESVGWSSVPVAGNGETGYSGDGGDALDARLGERLSIDVGPDGEVYIADTDSGRVREVTPERAIDTVEHSGAGDSEDDCAEEVVEGFQWCPSNLPHAVVSDDDGNAHIAASTEISTVDGDGESTVLDTIVENEDGSSSSAKPGAIALDSHGNLYFAVPEQNQVRVLAQVGEIPTSVPWVTLVFWVAVGLALAVTPRRREVAGWVRHNVPRAWSRLRAGVRSSMDTTPLEDRTARSTSHGDAPTGGEDGGA